MGHGGKGVLERLKLDTLPEPLGLRFGPDALGGLELRAVIWAVLCRVIVAALRCRVRVSRRAVEGMIPLNWVGGGRAIRRDMALDGFGSTC